MTPSVLNLLPIIVLTAGAAVIDLRTRHIPNWLVLLGFAVGSAVHLTTSTWWGCATGRSIGSAIGSASLSLLLGCFACAIVPVVMFRVGAMGGGDVKLLAVVGAGLGPQLGIQVELTAFILAALYAPARLACEGQLLRMLGNTAVLVTNPFLPKTRRRPLSEAALTSLPFGPAIFLATLFIAAAERW